MEPITYLRFAIALALVLALIAGAAWVVRRLGLVGVAPTSRGGRRLSLVESLVIDTKRRLILVKQDDEEHLILLGPAGDVPLGAVKSDPRKGDR